MRLPAFARVPVCALAFVALAATAAAQPARDTLTLRPQVRGDGVSVVDWDPGALARAERLQVRRFPLGPERAVELSLESFTVTRPDTRFVRGRVGAADEPLDFDPASVSLFRGSVTGQPDSRVFLTRHRGRVTGWVSLDGGAVRYLIAAGDEDGREGVPGRSAVFRATTPTGLPPDVPFCGTDTRGGEALDPGAGLLSLQSLGTSSVGRLHLELAVDTDYEYFALFEDEAAAAAYLVALYAQVSDVYVRDVDTRIDLVFARIWTTPNDLFNDVDPSPLTDFRNHWNANMGAVQRDVAQLLSGRRDYPFGGQASLSAVCGSFGYSVVGYAQGFFPDPAKPSPYHYDISVTAHEIGHNAGTGHSHDSPNFVDTCDDPLTTPQRGSIMSYCGQTWSGGNANRDLYFHSRIQQNIDAFLAGASCVVPDCNENGVDDAQDVLGASADANGNGVPDECEDCNGNLVLDDADISGGGSLDLNANAIPDECEPDCNVNGVPDDLDIATATSLDDHGNDVPDECEADCNANLVSDYSEIQLDMSLDVDRDSVLDSCQDCDGVGPGDLAQLAGSHDLWLASGVSGASAQRFYATTGVRVAASSGSAPAEGQDLIVAPGNRVLVSSASDDRVLEYDADGAFLGDLVSSGSGGLAHPAGLLMTPGGTLLVASRDGDAVLAYDGSSGAAQGAFVTAGAGGLVAPFGLALGPNGNLFVTSDSDEVLEYDGSNGAFLGVFVSAADNGGLEQPRGLVFKPDGNLLVTSYGTHQTFEYHRTTGASLGAWAVSGTSTRLNQESPWGIRVAPNGNVFIVRTGETFGSSGGGGGHDHGDDELHLTNAQMYEFDVQTGGFVRAHVNGNDHGHEFPTGFDFLPGWDEDCNRNQLPDSCDITSGFSQDVDSSGIPDECEIDCNANGNLDRLDIIPFGASFDCNANLVPDECDSALGIGGACETAAELSCSDGFDNDRDGFADCFDPDCNGVACSVAILLAAGFDADPGGFAYSDDSFRGTSEPAYASGSHDAAAGFEADGGLRVDLGGVDNADITGMSGGWQTTLVVPVAADLELAFRYRLTQSNDYEDNETSQVLVSFDGTLYGSDGEDFVADMNGDGGGGEERGTGWQSFHAALGNFPAGSYPLVVGGFNSLKTTATEFTEIQLDDVGVIAQLPPACQNGIDDDDDGLTDLADPGCDDAADLSERSPVLPCDDGADNDDDGVSDFDPDPGEGDPGCLDPTWALEDPQCQDGLENDTDGLIDFDGGASIHGMPLTAADPQCVGKPWRVRERPSSCGLGFELAAGIGALGWARRRRRV